MDLKIPILLDGVVVGHAIQDEKGGGSFISVEHGNFSEPFRRDVSNKGADWLGFNVSQYLNDRLAVRPAPESIELMDGMTETARTAHVIEDAIPKKVNQENVEGFFVAPECVVNEVDIASNMQASYDALEKETRTISSTGGEKGVKPQKYSLMPRQALDTISEIYDFGIKKYAPHNWRKGYEWSKSYDALQRHLNAWWDREENDPESGLSHLGHAGSHIFVLIVFSKDKKYAQFDDRYGAIE